MAELMAIIMTYSIPKYLDIPMCIGLSHKEMMCKCDNPECNTTKVSPLLLKAYSDLRTYWGKSLTINSGFRCQFHNKRVGGKPDSRHSDGLALDVSLDGFTEVDREAFIKLARKLFDYTRIYDTFVHVQINPKFNHELKY